MPTPFSQDSLGEHTLLNILNKRHRQLISDVKECELSYFRSGRLYYAFPVSLLHDLLGPEDVSRCEKAFVIADDGRDTEVVRTLRHIRDLRDGSKVCIRRGYFDSAEDKLIIGLGVADELKDQLEGLERLVARVEYMLGPNGILPYADLPLPDRQPERYGRMREWVLRLPESQKALELGIETEAQILTAFYEEEDEVEDAYEASESGDEEEVMERRLSGPTLVGYPDDDAELDEGTMEAFEPRDPRSYSGMTSAESYAAEREELEFQWMLAHFDRGVLPGAREFR